MSWILQTITMLGIGIIGFFIKRTLDKLEKTSEHLGKKIDELNEKYDQEVDKLRREISDLKNDLPFLYVLREDFLRVMNNVEGKLDKITSYVVEGRSHSG
ncbi:MAG: hypothetical protein Q4A78_07340 [Peptostreptococcaceae bacterium]|nr:hypothetical protein [Peptostreptococcaceae bacterium]